MLGVCCQWMVPKGKTTVNAFEESALQLGRFQSGAYSDEKIADAWIGNINGIRKMIPAMSAEGVRMLRISSNLLPLFDKIWDNPKYTWLRAPTEAALAQLGAELAGWRITTHPGQFVVISSDSDTVVQNSIRELQYHAAFLDMCGFSADHTTTINIHGGKRGAADRLIASIRTLPANVKSRLTLENDETCYSIADLLPISQATGVPIVFDSHHYTFNPGGMDGATAMVAAAQTWDVRPVQHLSCTEPGKESGSFTERRSHSNYITYMPDYQMEYYRSGACDIEMECKMKNLGFLQWARAQNLDIGG